MSTSLMPTLARCLVACAAFASVAAAQPAPPAPDATLASRPDTVIWGYITADLPPALTIKSGQTVKIDTVSHQGLLTKEDPVTFFAAAGIPREQVLQDAIDIYKTVPRGKGMSVHVLTGPIYVEDAAPGDMLEVRVHKLEHRVPYGVNNSGPTSGVLPGLLSAPAPKIIKFDMARNVALFSDDIEVPLSPFLGIMMGMDLDLNIAMRHATREAVDFLREEFGLSAADAYSLASIAVDFRVAEAVDSVQMIYGMIPKKLFKKTPDYWARQGR